MMSRAIKKLNQIGIMHRDIKPANIFLTNDNEIRLGDLGLAKKYVKGENYEQFLGTPVILLNINHIF